MRTSLSEITDQTRIFRASLFLFLYIVDWITIHSRIFTSFFIRTMHGLGINLARNKKKYNVSFTSDIHAFLIKRNAT